MHAVNFGPNSEVPLLADLQFITWPNMSISSVLRSSELMNAWQQTKGQNQHKDYYQRHAVGCTVN